MAARRRAPPDETLAIDTMEDRPLVGTTDWQQHALVLDVAAAAATIAFHPIPVPFMDERELRKARIARRAAVDLIRMG